MGNNETHNEAMSFGCSNINVKLGGQSILENVSLEIHPGQISFLKGHSGCGKSTLIRAMLGIVPITSGRVFLDGQEVFSGSKRNRHSVNPVYPFVSALFQELFLWPHLTCQENLDVANQEKMSSTFDNQIRVFQEQLGVTPLLNRFPSQLSHGQRQRVAFFRALSNEPKYLMLDEPTSALDSMNVKIFGDILDSLKKMGAGILIITHDDRLISSKDGTVNIMENGRMKNGK